MTRRPSWVPASQRRKPCRCSFRRVRTKASSPNSRTLGRAIPLHRGQRGRRLAHAVCRGRPESPAQRHRRPLGDKVSRTGCAVGCRGSRGCAPAGSRRAGTDRRRWMYRRRSSALSISPAAKDSKTLVRPRTSVEGETGSVEAPGERRHRAESVRLSQVDPAKTLLPQLRMSVPETLGSAIVG